MSATGGGASAVWFNPALGVAGDMVLASLIDLGADEVVVRDQLGRLGLPGWRLEVSATTRRGLVATAVDVTVPDRDHHRPWSRIDELLADVALEPAVADGARRTFAALARAEASVHGIDVDDVHFHEVGALDAIVDVVGSWAALWSLGGADLPVVSSAPVGLGAGTAPMAHGRLPVPAPAVLELLAGVPTVPVDTDRETATPTGVALLVTMSDRWGPPPAGTVRASGRGAGGADPSTHPNVLGAVSMVPTDGAIAPAVADPAVAGRTVSARLIETNLDDVTGEVVAAIVEAALAAGADDAWAVATTAKKGRPGLQLSVLCRPELADELARLVASGTGTLGWRVRDVDKTELERRTEQVELDGHRVRVKVGPYGAKPEHDDLAAMAGATGRPVRELAAAALEAWRGGTVTSG